MTLTEFEWHVLFWLGIAVVLGYSMIRYLDGPRGR